MAIHVPVLPEEVLEYLNVKEGGIYIDATLNGGGHSRLILNAKPHVQVIGIERDPEIALRIQEEHIDGLTVINENYIHMRQALAQLNKEKVDGVLFDFGFSSWHVDSSGKGFSFLKDEPLDMRYSDRDPLTASDIVNTMHEKGLADIFEAYGEEKRAKAIASAIVEHRKKKKIETTGDLVGIIEKIKFKGSRKIHPATQVFQALRIAVNRELECVRDGLEAAMEVIKDGGRVVAISFHSLEDRIVKDMFKQKGGVLTKKPVTATREEAKNNPRSRSAKLRAWEKVL